MNTTKHMKDHSSAFKLILGLFFGFIFGFLLHKGGATKYDVIIGQLLLKDYTVLKIMLSAVVTGMIGIYIMKGLGWVSLYPKHGSIGMNVIGALFFGIGFAVLGYCPGTIAGAIGNGYLDALIGGLPGILIGSGLYAMIYPKIRNNILKKGEYGSITLPEVLKVNEWFVIIPLCSLIILFLFWLETSGL